ncbi:MAG: 2-amino-4-hydroxy-6-hydroxymethyldihydropteridine diphosphokinase [Planctomycetota bacterium]|jgi:GTP cyclohydrolase I
MNRAIIAVGSNIEPAANVEKAEAILAAEQRMLGRSRFVKTAPQGFTEQADFLNGAFSIETKLNQQQLAEYLKDVESRLGRVRTENKNGPRTIDLDVVVFNGAIVDDDYNRYDFVRKAVDELMGEANQNNGINTAAIEEHFRAIMEKGLGLDLTDPNFTDTPARVARSYREIFQGLETADEQIHDIFKQSFPAGYDGIVLEKGITVFSMCPHHFLPIRYEVSMGYIPNGQALGLSKLARIVELMAKMPSLQEDFTERIVDEIDDHISPQGVICVVKGAHYCMQMRGVKQKDTWTTTSSARGIFLEKQEMELKFYNLLRNT